MLTNVFPTLKYPGRATFIKGQLDSLEREGVEITLRYIDAIDGRFAFLKMVPRIWLDSISGRYDLIHAHYGTSGVVARLQLRLPVVVSYLGSDLLGLPGPNGKKSVASRVVAIISRFLSYLTDVSIVKSQEMANLLPKEVKPYIIPNGVDFKLFQPIKRDEACRQIGLDPKKKYVLFPSNADWPRKCFSTAQNAVDILKKEFNNVELINLYGKQQSEVPIYMSACDAMVLTSLWEGSPNVIKESMACNLPIVSVDVGDVKNIIQDCQGCYLAERNPYEISEKLMIVLQSGQRTNGRDKIRHLEIQKVAKRIIQIYGSVLRIET
ncbi:glycosyltransferase [candidate division KSB1 bacterium]|nr:glycosyltransferase [candidate division KSB1 bacterium]